MKAIASDDAKAQYPEMAAPNLAKENGERVAQALENLAKEIRAGNVAPTRMEISLFYAQTASLRISRSITTWCDIHVWDADV